MTAAEQVNMAIGAGRYTRANGADIFYVEAGQGEPLVLLHGGLVSNAPAWNGSPVAYGSHLPTFARHFHVIAPDTRGHGRTLNPERGAISYAQLVDDVAALIAALGLERPMLCGFSDGGTTATLLGIRHPGLARAIVNDAGYDLFNPSSPTHPMTRHLFGGDPTAMQADPVAAERAFQGIDQLRAMLALMKTEYADAQGSEYWQTLLAEVFDRWTQSPGYTFDDLAALAAPTLILVGDRDHFCSPEEAAIAYRKLPAGELAIVPNTGHWINEQKVQIAIDFLHRQSDL